MRHFSGNLLLSLANKILLSILLAGLAVSAAAHTYFFGVTELNVNPKSKHIEIIHQFTAHDIENTIAEEKQIHFSAEHPKYENYIQDYFEKNFSLTYNNTDVKLTWVGIEIRRGQIFAYQESNNQNFLANLVVKNTILVDTYPKQINTLNYQDLTFGNNVKLQGSLTFNYNKRFIQIDVLSSQMYKSGSQW
jgi:hypothetical protein